MAPLIKMLCMTGGPKSNLSWMVIFCNPHYNTKDVLNISLLWGYPMLQVQNNKYPLKKYSLWLMPGEGYPP